MSSRWEQLYGEHDRARLVPEPVKRVDAPSRTPFERDRARVVHAASLRRLAAKTQVLGPQVDDFVRNRLTHSLEVAQVARDVAHPLGCHPDLAETAALAHDLGHPPFGHNGEQVLDDLTQSIGGFEGNAQTLRILTRLEAKSFDGDRSLGLNLTRATLDACTKYPWGNDGRGKFGVYADDLAVFEWLREGVAGERRCVEAQVMDLADDVAYSVHDLEDGIVYGDISLREIAEPSARAEVWETVRSWYLPDASDEALEAAYSALRVAASWPHDHDGSRRSLAALKNLTSDVIGVFCGAVQQATRAVYGDQSLVRHEADLVIPETTWLQIHALKGIAAHYVMTSAERLAIMARQRDLLQELFVALVERPDLLDPMFAQDHEEASDDAARARVVVDQVASLTDARAIAWHRELTT